MAKIKIEATEQEYEEIKNKFLCLLYETQSTILKTFNVIDELVPSCCSTFAYFFERIEPPRWRAEKGERYWTINCFNKPCISNDAYVEIDDELWAIGNYYRTEEEALAAAERVKAAYKGCM